MSVRERACLRAGVCLCVRVCVCACVPVCARTVSVLTRNNHDILLRINSNA